MKIKRYAIVLLGLILSLALFGCKETTTEAPTITEQPTTVVTEASTTTALVTESPTTEVPTTAAPTTTVENVTTTESDLLLVYISEYGEGSSYNKWIELYNPNDVSVTLTGYKLINYYNGKDEVEDKYILSLDDITIDANSTYILINAQANATLQAVAGQTSSYVINFNGDDAVALTYNYVIVDLIGVIGEQPSVGYWIVGDGSTKDHTLVRVSTVNQGNATFTASEWVSYTQDNLDSLGQR